MSSSRSRGDRRRRVLNDEVRSQSKVEEKKPSALADGEPGDMPRYGTQANIENHPQVTDYVPRKRRQVVLLIGGLLALAVGSAALSVYAKPIAAFLPAIDAIELTERLSTGLTTWLSAVVLVATALIARLIHMLRRHRVDDEQGHYRVWWWAAAGALLLSANAAIGSQHLLAASLTAASGWSGVAAGQGWWMVPTVLVGGWIAARSLAELSESRISFSAGLAAVASYSLAAAMTLGWVPSFLGPWAPAVAGILPLTGHIFSLAAVLLFARQVVLEVQGLIEVAPRSSKTESLAEEKPLSIQTEAAEQSERAASEPPEKKPQEATETAATAESRWVDGSERESYDDEQPKRKLSKAERKRLRKQNARNRAA